jgi:hypothetical protein
MCYTYKQAKQISFGGKQLGHTPVGMLDILEQKPLPAEHNP